MSLRERRADGARRCSGNGGRLSTPGVLAIRAGAPVYRVLEQGGNGAVVLGRHEQQPIGCDDLRLEAHDALRQFGLEILVIERQVADRNELELCPVGAEARQRMRELGVDGFAAIAADDDGDLDLCHSKPILVTI